MACRILDSWPGIEPCPLHWKYRVLTAGLPGKSPGVDSWFMFFFMYYLIILYGKKKIREGNGNPLQYSCLENPMDGGAWWAAVHGIAKSWTRLSNFTFTFQFHALEKDMATHSSVLAWRTPGTGEPGGLPSLGSHRVGHDWSDLAAAAAGSFDPVGLLWWLWW